MKTRKNEIGTRANYVSPECEAIEVKVEGVICTSNPAMLMLFTEWGDSNAAGAELIEDEGYNL